MQLRSSSRLLLISIVILVYLVVGKFALMLASLHASASPVWPCAGIALGAILVLGYRVWPAIFVGAFLVNVTNAGDVATSLAIATGNTLEALAAAWLVIQHHHQSVTWCHKPCPRWLCRLDTLRRDLADLVAGRCNR